MTAREEIFTYEEEPGHEAIFLYRGKIIDKKILEKEIIPNPDSDEFPAVWISINEVLNDSVILYPSFDYKKILVRG